MSENLRTPRVQWYFGVWLSCCHHWYEHAVQTNSFRLQFTNSYDKWQHEFNDLHMPHVRRTKMQRICEQPSNKRLNAKKKTPVHILFLQHPTYVYFKCIQSKKKHIHTWNEANESKVSVEWGILQRTNLAQQYILPNTWKFSRTCFMAF